MRVSMRAGEIKAKVPAAAYFCGGLTLDDQARILNWIYTKFPNFNPVHLEVAAAHARTLLVAYQYQDEFLENQSQTDQKTPLNQHYVLQKAWQRLVEFTGKTVDGKSKPRAADVDYEAVNILEEIMFDRTHEAGTAGNCQWGLDVAPLEDNWFPYNGPESQHNNLRDGTESELETGPDYQDTVQIEATIDPGNEKRAPRPRPRLKRKIDKVENIEYGIKKKQK
ncbi:hypothetical protein K435DRAFT_861257 [Dendrothele bispora CBS 962.96]|uniref:Uncharacterized protein n=1 Tax=Dendrothele bispora (strain CBS 962.96) TaxID=1314807 RepID=A0A4S8LWC6_DENBC|nr:hypothetical protein K435DRAFT_861257 [Dendrothele bispora CBS 962.96]